MPLVEWVLQAELTYPLGHSKNQLSAILANNRGNGLGKKTLKGDFDALLISFSRDKAGTFELQLITKHQTRWSGVNGKTLLLYAWGHDSTRVSKATTGNA